MWPKRRYWNRICIATSSVTAYPPLRRAGTRATTICECALHCFMRKEGQVESLDAPTLSFSNEPDGLVDNKGHRGRGGQA